MWLAKRNVPSTQLTTVAREETVICTARSQICHALATDVNGQRSGTLLRHSPKDRADTKPMGCRAKYRLHCTTTPLLTCWLDAATSTAVHRKILALQLTAIRRRYRRTREYQRRRTQASRTEWDEAAHFSLIKEWCCCQRLAGENLLSRPAPTGKHPSQRAMATLRSLRVK